VQRLGQLDQTSVELSSVLSSALQHTNPNVRFEAAQAAGQVDQIASLQEMTTALLYALKDEEAEVRYAAAESLERLGHISPEILEVQREARATAEKRLHWLDQVHHVDESLVHKLLRDMQRPDEEWQIDSAQELALLGRRFPESAELIEQALRQAIENPTFDDTLIFMMRLPRDYAYESLWLLVVNDELEER
jgi:HEAT repeat protein